MVATVNKSLYQHALDISIFVTHWKEVTFLFCECCPTRDKEKKYATEKSRMQEKIQTLR